MLCGVVDKARFQPPQLNSPLLPQSPDSSLDLNLNWDRSVGAASSDRGDLPARKQEEGFSLGINVSELA
jgi:hypothetical protein